jgi:solute carrier family 35, member F5
MVNMLTERGQTIFADNTYSKPYFVTYTNTAFFLLPLIPMLLKQLHDDGYKVPELRQLLRRRVGKYSILKEDNNSPGYSRVRTEDDEEEAAPLYKSTEEERRNSLQGRIITGSPSASMVLEDRDGNEQLSRVSTARSSKIVMDRMTVLETAKFSIEFCILWFAANYTASACLEYTTVASATILASTSSMFPMATTLAFLFISANPTLTCIFRCMDSSDRCSYEGRNLYSQKTPRCTSKSWRYNSNIARRYQRRQ